MVELMITCKSPQVAQCLVKNCSEEQPTSWRQAMVQFYVFVCTNNKRKVSNTVQEKGTQQVQAAERHTGVWQKQRRSKLARSDPTMEEGKQNDLQRSLRNINIYIYMRPAWKLEIA